MREFGPLTSYGLALNVCSFFINCLHGFTSRNCEPVGLRHDLRSGSASRNSYPLSRQIWPTDCRVHLPMSRSTARCLDEGTECCDAYENSWLIAVIFPSKSRNRDLGAFTKHFPHAAAAHNGWHTGGGFRALKSSQESVIIIKSNLSTGKRSTQLLPHIGMEPYPCEA